MLSLPWAHNPASWNQGWSQGLKEFCFWHWVWCLCPAHPLCINHCATVVMWDSSAVHPPAAGGVGPRSWDHTHCALLPSINSAQSRVSQMNVLWCGGGMISSVQGKKKNVQGEDREWEKCWKGKIKCKCCCCHLEDSLVLPVNCR